MSEELGPNMRKLQQEREDVEAFAEIGRAVVDQLSFTGSHYCDTGFHSGMFRYSESLYLSREQRAFIATVRRRSFKDVPDTSEEETQH